MSSVEEPLIHNERKNNRCVKLIGGIIVGHGTGVYSSELLITEDATSNNVRDYASILKTIFN